MKMMGLSPAVHLLARLPEHGVKLTVSRAALALVLGVSGVFTSSSTWMASSSSWTPGCPCQLPPERILRPGELSRPAQQPALRGQLPALHLAGLQASLVGALFCETAERGCRVPRGTFQCITVGCVGLPHLAGVCPPSAAASQWWAH